jgi:hypothetical protein
MPPPSTNLPIPAARASGFSYPKPNPETVPLVRCRTAPRASKAGARSWQGWVLQGAFIVVSFLNLSACPEGVAAQDVLWSDPGDVARIDFAAPAGATKTLPTPPFHFLSEDFSGTSPKVEVLDSKGVKWRVKAGPEVKSESFATRFVAALGYHADSVVYVKSGKILDAPPLIRAAGFIQPDGSFWEAAFERRDADRKLSDEDWAWHRNPFVATKELRGLKVLVMLLSNWDNKDARDREQLDSNMGIVERRQGNSIRRIYYVSDWGQTLGGWGTELAAKGWDCATFTQQTGSFVQGVEGNLLRFGFEGLHMDGFKADITVDDVRWLLRYLGKVTDAQLRAGLQASGANTAETECYANALRQRIDQLRGAASAAQLQPLRRTAAR